MPKTKEFSNDFKAAVVNALKQGKIQADVARTFNVSRQLVSVWNKAFNMRKTVENKPIFLAANTTSILQPMDQGVIEATKRLCRKSMLAEVLVYFQDDEEEADKRGEQTLKNLKAYNIKSTIYNWDKAWKDVERTILTHGWNNILKDESDDENEDYEGLASIDFQQVLKLAGENAVIICDIEEWLEDPGYHLLSEEEIAQNVLKLQSEGESKDEKLDEDTDITPKIKLKDVHASLDILINYIDSSNDDNFDQFYPSIKLFREEVIRKQQESIRQFKITCFFPEPDTSFP